MKLADFRMPRRPFLLTGRRLGAFTVASGALLSAAALALTGCSSGGSSLALSANARPQMRNLAANYQVITRNNNRDLTFNQLLGINNEGVIAGYFGSGAAGHPNKGYVLLPPFSQRNYFNENFPRSVQTQVTGLNDNGITVGFWSSMNNANEVNNNFGFVAVNGRFFTVNFPTGDNARPPVNQLLGVNDRGVAVGFYTNADGNNRGYEFDIRTHRFTRVLVPGAPPGVRGPSLTAAAINNRGDVAGFFNKSATQEDAFLRLNNGRFLDIAFPGASSTQALGVNDNDEVVGTYTVGTGDAAVSHGFTFLNGQFGTFDIPNGSGTVVNGINNEADLVGFFTDARGNTEGFLALP